MAHYFKQCQYCGIGFEASRCDAKYCQATCRAQAARLRRKRKSTPSATVVDSGQSISMNTLLQLVERQNELIQSLMQTIERLQRVDGVAAIQKPHITAMKSPPGTLGTPVEMEPLPEVKVRESKSDNGQATTNFLNSLMALQG
jgi:hypothetical protein